MARILLITVCLFISRWAFATTWDEPWQERVVKESTWFVLGKVKSNDEKKGVTIDIIKTLGGTELKGEIRITSFFMLDLCSTSGGHGPEFQFEDFKQAYFFIKQNDKGEYCIPTPTAGFARIVDGEVYATYRHSYHQCMISTEVYEKTMTAIFNHYHGLAYDAQYIRQFINESLAFEPAGFDEKGIKTFFAQHVALETMYHLRITGAYSRVVLFLNDTSNFHNQVSAARALIVFNTPECKQALLKVLSDTSRDHFVQVICAWTLGEFKPKELKDQLVKISETASDEDTGFGGNIMDPRVCTHFPEVKKALVKLIATL